MSVNIYVIEEKVRQVSGFSDRPYSDKSTDRDRKVGAMSIFADKGHWYIMYNDEDPIPSILIGCVDKVSLRASMTRDRARETGIYRHKTAEGEVEIDLSGKKEVYSVKIVAKNLDDAKELLRKIKTGSVRPEESYEGSQQGKSAAELGTELSSTKWELEALQKRFDRLGQEAELVQERVKRTYRLAADLDKEKWPFCRKSRIVDDIHRALNGVS